MNTNDKLFWKAYDKSQEHSETGYERIVRLAKEKFGIDMMQVVALDVRNEQVSGNADKKDKEVLSMSDAEVIMLISDFVFKYTGERLCQE